MSDGNLSKTDLESNLTDIVNDIAKLKKWLNVFTTKEPIEVNSKMAPTTDNDSDQLKDKKAPKLTPGNNAALNKTTTKSSTDTKTAQTNDANSAPSTKPSTKKSTSAKKSTTKKSSAKKSTTKPSTTKPSAKKSTTKKSSTKIATKKPKTASGSKSKSKSAASTAKAASAKKGTKKAKSATKPPNILEDELAETLTPEEIDNFQIERVDMDKLTHKVCDLLIERESDGMLQADLYKKLKLSARNGARLSLKLERMGTVSRVKILENERWTYKLILKKTPVSTDSLNGAPCLTCAVEQRCSVDGEISPMTCPYIEDWVLMDLKRTRSK